MTMTNLNIDGNKNAHVAEVMQDFAEAVERLLEDALDDIYQAQQDALEALQQVEGDEEATAREVHNRLEGATLTAALINGTASALFDDMAVTIDYI